MLTAWSWLRHDQHIFWHDAPVVVEVAENGGSHDVEIMLALIKAGADVNSRSDFGQTAIMNAAGGHRTTLIAILLAHQADPTLVNRRGATARDFASDDEAIVRLLKRAKARK